MGKSAIIYVVGLSLLITYGLFNINQTSTESITNYSQFYAGVMAHTIAVSGANIGGHLIFQNPAYSTNLYAQPFAGGTFDLVFQHHIDSVSVICTGQYQGAGGTYFDTVVAGYRHTSMAKYGWFSDSELSTTYPGSPPPKGDWMFTGDSIFSPLHTNGFFLFAGSPYLGRKVTGAMLPRLLDGTASSVPSYMAGSEFGVAVPYSDGDIAPLLNAAFVGGGLYVNTDVALSFFPDGTIGRKVPAQTGAIKNDTVLLSSASSNGVFAVRGGDIRITGIYKGHVVVAAFKGTTLDKGNVWIDGSGIVAATDPSQNPNSPDILGMVAEQNAFITRDDSRNSSSIVTIQGALYCVGGGLQAQDCWSLPGMQGRVSIYGLVWQKNAGQLNFGSVITTVSGNPYPVITPAGGFLRTVRFDPRFLAATPPFWPTANKYELVTWWEK